MLIPFPAGTPRDCASEGHDHRLSLAARVPRGSAIDQRRPAMFLVVACTGCGQRVR